MIDATAPIRPSAPDVAVLDAIAEAYAAGDAPHGERLFTQALDDGLPWDQVCAAAARGVARRYGEQQPCLRPRRVPPGSLTIPSRRVRARVGRVRPAGACLGRSAQQASPVLRSRRASASSCSLAPLLAVARQAALLAVAALVAAVDRPCRGAPAAAAARRSGLRRRRPAGARRHRAARPRRGRAARRAGSISSCRRSSSRRSWPRPGRPSAPWSIPASRSWRGC